MSDEIPEMYLIFLKENYQNIKSQNLLLSNELVTVLKLLKRNNVKAVTYKGPTLVISSYGDVSLRKFVDIDIYVEKEDVIRIKEVLIANGYKVLEDLNSSREKMYLKSQRELKFINMDNCVLN